MPRVRDSWSVEEKLEWREEVVTTLAFMSLVFCILAQIVHCILKERKGIKEERKGNKGKGGGKDEMKERKERN